MYRLLLIFCFLFILGDSFSQKWDNTFGTPGKDETFIDVLESYDRGYLLSGNSYIPTNSSWLIKTDINGNLLWDKFISHNSYDFFSGYFDQNSSGELVVGRTLKLGPGNNWPSLVKLDPCGNKLWCRAFIDEDFMWGWFNDVILLNNGDVIGLANLIAEDNYDDNIWLYYISNNGDLLWKKSYSSTSVHPLVMIRSGESLTRFDNEYIITGHCYYPLPSNPNTGYKRPFFIGIDTSFNEKWILPFGLNDTIIGNAYNVIALNDSVYMGVGYVWETGSDQNSILMYFNSYGEDLGYTQIYNTAIGPNIEDNVTVDIERLNDSLFITSTLFGPGEGFNDYGEFIIDSSANIYKIESRPNTRGISKLVKTYDDKYIIGCTYRIGSNDDIYLYKINDSLQHDTIYPGVYTYDSLCPYQIQSGIVDISNCLLVTDVGATPTPKEYYLSLNTIPIKAFPNPSNTGSITLQYSNTEHHSEMELKCFNVFGKEVHKEKIYQHQGESRLNVHVWQKGIYLAIVYSDGRPVGRVKFVVR